MSSLTINLTLEQDLEFVQNFPSEYKKAVKQKLQNEEVEEIEARQNKDADLEKKKGESRSEDEIAERLAIVKCLGGSSKVEEDFNYKEVYTNLIIKNIHKNEAFIFRH